MNECKICGEELDEDEGWIPTGGEGYWCQDCYDEQLENIFSGITLERIKCLIIGDFVEKLEEIEPNKKQG